MGKTALFIGIGSFIGGAGRFLLSQFIQNKIPGQFPFGTLGVNIIGCFLIGAVFALADRGTISAEWRLFLATGIIGGFTTFSAFSLETIHLLRSGHPLPAITYVSASVFIGLGATYLGLISTRLL